MQPTENNPYFLLDLILTLSTHDKFLRPDTTSFLKK
jgi:hypothetical protein